MANQCAWCNRYIGDKDGSYWFNVTENGKKYKSKEIFCSPKCRHEYPYGATPDKSGSSALLVFIVIVIIIYFLV